MTKHHQKVKLTSDLGNSYVYRTFTKKRRWCLCGGAKGDSHRKNSSNGGGRLLMLSTPARDVDASWSITLQKGFQQQIERNMYDGIVVQLMHGGETRVLFEANIRPELAGAESDPLVRGDDENRVSRLIELCITNEEPSQCALHTNDGQTLLVRCVPLFGQGRVLAGTAWQTGQVRDAAQSIRDAGLSAAMVIDTVNNVTVVNHEWLCQRNLVADLLTHNGDAASLMLTADAPYTVETEKNAAQFPYLFATPDAEALLNQPVMHILAPQVAPYVRSLLEGGGGGANDKRRLVIVLQNHCFALSMGRMQMAGSNKLVGRILGIELLVDGVQSQIRQMAMTAR